MWIIGFTAVVNYIVGAICIQKGKSNKSAQLLAGGQHLQTDTYSTAGIIVGLVLIWYTKLAWLDGVVSLLFAVFYFIYGLSYPAGIRRRYHGRGRCEVAG
jgi:divalent metal cation (Fe/Co/Zn/Cd) transporter